MALLYITEFDSLVTPGEGGNAQVARLPAIAVQTPVVIGAGSLLSAAFNLKTKFIRVHTDAICSIAYDGTATPTATVNSMRMSSESTEYFGVNGGAKLAVIANT